MIILTYFYILSFLRQIKLEQIHLIKYQLIILRLQLHFKSRQQVHNIIVQRQYELSTYRQDYHLLFELITPSIQQFQSSLLNRKNLQFMFEIYQTTQDSDQLFDIFQSHKRVCAHHIKIASQKLYIDEAKRIFEANQLLEKIALKQRVKDLSEWDVFSTRDSVVFQDQLSLNLSIISGGNKSKILSRKSALTTRQNSRDFQGQISQCLTEISSECSVKTYSTIKKCVEDFKKLKTKLFEMQKKERNLKQQQKFLEQLQQKNIIYANKLQDNSFSIERLKQQNAHLKAELAKSTELLHKKQTEINSQKKIKIYEQIMNKSNSTPKKQDINTENSFTNENISIVLNVLKQKQRIVNLRYDQIRIIEQNIERSLFKQFQTCTNCCSMLKKVKTSILNYKNYLQRQAEQFQLFFDKYKTSIFNDEQ